MKQDIRISDISNYSIEGQVLIIDDELQHRKEKDTRDVLSYYISRLPRTDVSARSLAEVLALIQKRHGGVQMDFTSIGI